MNYKIEKETENGFVFVKELKGIYFGKLKSEVESMYGRCSINSTDVDSNILWVRPISRNETYKITCLYEE